MPVKGTNHVIHDGYPHVNLKVIYYEDQHIISILKYYAFGNVIMDIAATVTLTELDARTLLDDLQLLLADNIPE